MNETEKKTWRAGRLDFLYREIEKLSTELSSAGVASSISVDGVATTFDRAGVLAQIKEYKREIASLEGRSAPLILVFLEFFRNTVL